MKLLPIIIGIIVFGSLLSFLCAEYWGTSTETIFEDNVTLRRCSGDRFSFIRGTYLYPVTEEEIEREKEAVLSRVNASGGPMPRAGGSGGGGGGPGGSEPREVAWGYCVDYNGSSSGFGYANSKDSRSKDAVEESDKWYQDRIVNQSLEVNVTCESRVVTERFKGTLTGVERIL